MTALTDTAERLDALADIAELMGDPAGAADLRCSASNRRMEAMAVLDELQA